jgi:hypothetical protein
MRNVSEFVDDARPPLAKPIVRYAFLAAKNFFLGEAYALYRAEIGTFEVGLH